MMVQGSAIARRSFLYLLIATLLIFLSVVYIQPSRAQDATIGACAVTPDRVDGQGFKVSSLGFKVASLGFKVSSLGFKVSSLGFKVSSLGFKVSSLNGIQYTYEEIIDEILTASNELNSDWLTDYLGFVDGGTGSGYNSVPVFILVVDDFSINPDSHGYGVMQLIQQLVTDSGATGITVQAVDISPYDYDATRIAGAIKFAVDGILSTHPDAHFVVNMSFGLVPCEDPPGRVITDSETGETYTTNKPFNFSEYIQGAPEEREFTPVKPILVCVVEEGGEGGYGHHGKKKNKKWWKWSYHWGHHEDEVTYTAYFSYENNNLYTVEIPVGSFNKFAPDPKDRGQPTSFAPGPNEFEYAFSVEYDKPNLQWKLGNKHVKADKDSADDLPCPPSIPGGGESTQYAPEGYSLTEYFVEEMGIPEQFVDDYFKDLFGDAEEPVSTSDPFANIQTLMRYYLEKSYNDATDGNPETGFALIPVASSGNFGPLLGFAPLKPASYPEVLATAASVGSDNQGLPWVLSHTGNAIAPGVTYVIARDSNGDVTNLGAGTSYAAPYMSALSSLWMSYPNACQFNAPSGSTPLLPPLSNGALAKNSNMPFTGESSPLDCALNAPPVLSSFYEGNVPIEEGGKTNVGSISDEDDNIADATFVTNVAGVQANYEGEGTWSVEIDGRFDGPTTVEVTITAIDARGGEGSITIVLEISNVAPTAEGGLVASPSEVIVGSPVQLSLIPPFVDPSNDDKNFALSFMFDCGDSEGENFQLSEGSSFNCTYDEPGTYSVKGKISDDDGGFTIYPLEGSLTVTVEPGEEPTVCNYASEVIWYDPGRRKDGGKISDDRDDPQMALGAPQNTDDINFVALGFGKDFKYLPGILIVSFENNVIVNGPGKEDVRIWETTFNDTNSPWKDYPEAVHVFAAKKFPTWHWVYLGTTTEKDQWFSLKSLPYARYIKLIEASNPKSPKFGKTADGFDVDAIEAKSCTYLPPYHHHYYGEIDHSDE